MVGWQAVTLLYFEWFLKGKHFNQKYSIAAEHNSQDKSNNGETSTLHTPTTGEITFLSHFETEEKDFKYADLQL